MGQWFLNKDKLNPHLQNDIQGQGQEMTLPFNTHIFIESFRLRLQAAIVSE